MLLCLRYSLPYCANVLSKLWLYVHVGYTELKVNLCLLSVQILTFADNEVYNRFILAYLVAVKLLCAVNYLDWHKNRQLCIKQYLVCHLFHNSRHVFNTSTCKYDNLGIYIIIYLLTSKRFICIMVKVHF